MKLRRDIGVLVATAFLLWVHPGLCSGPNVAAEFESANRLYEQGKFDEAIAGYQRLLDQGAVSPAVFFNLGNAWFKSGRIGRAIVAYRMAQQLSPRDPDIRANLQFARNQVQPPTTAPTRLAQWFGIFTLDEWARFAAAAFWALFATLAAGEAKPGWKRRLMPWTWAAGGAVLALGACVFLAYRAQREATSTAVVVEPETVVRQGPLDEALMAFVVHDGAEVKVLDSKDDWLQISVGRGRLGWIKRASVAFTGDDPAQKPSPDRNVARNLRADPQTRAGRGQIHPLRGNLVSPRLDPTSMHTRPAHPEVKSRNLAAKLA